ncbi:hypothetical protein [Agarivorans sp. 1_MG-2023]|uniref:hypothetical protein n=1 Tax=Agarivorans sp. 1_MG-2023 TaxID=3062634 RepID=UPI0026E42984|nr:hypothetical protein [Agarivorans sp. 1_MG-2023]MDO6766168.1 hypothetical protein [Agarivorans sp. 1_MG-2023]
MVLHDLKKIRLLTVNAKQFCNVDSYQANKTYATRQVSNVVPFPLSAIKNNKLAVKEIFSLNTQQQEELQQLKQLTGLSSDYLEHKLSLHLGEQKQ